MEVQMRLPPFSSLQRTPTAAQREMLSCGSGTRSSGVLVTSGSPAGSNSLRNQPASRQKDRGNTSNAERERASSQQQKFGRSRSFGLRSCKGSSEGDVKNAEKSAVVTEKRHEIQCNASYSEQRRPSKKQKKANRSQTGQQTGKTGMGTAPQSDSNQSGRKLMLENGRREKERDVETQSGTRQPRVSATAGRDSCNGLKPKTKAKESPRVKRRKHKSVRNLSSVDSGKGEELSSSCESTVFEPQNPLSTHLECKGQSSHSASFSSIEDEFHDAFSTLPSDDDNSSAFVTPNTSRCHSPSHQIQVNSVLRRNSSKPSSDSLLDELQLSLKQLSEERQKSLESPDCHVIPNGCAMEAQDLLEKVRLTDNHNMPLRRNHVTSEKSHMTSKQTAATTTSSKEDHMTSEKDHMTTITKLPGSLKEVAATKNQPFYVGEVPIDICNSKDAERNQEGFEVTDSGNGSVAPSPLQTPVHSLPKSPGGGITPLTLSVPLLSPSPTSSSPPSSSSSSSSSQPHSRSSLTGGSSSPQSSLSSHSTCPHITSSHSHSHSSHSPSPNTQISPSPSPLPLLLDKTTTEEETVVAMNANIEQHCSFGMQQAGRDADQFQTGLTGEETGQSCHGDKKEDEWPDLHVPPADAGVKVQPNQPHPLLSGGGDARVGGHPEVPHPQNLPAPAPYPQNMIPPHHFMAFDDPSIFFLPQHSYEHSFHHSYSHPFNPYPFAVVGIPTTQTSFYPDQLVWSHSNHPMQTTIDPNPSPAFQQPPILNNAPQPFAVVPDISPSTKTTIEKTPPTLVGGATPTEEEKEPLERENVESERGDGEPEWGNRELELEGTKERDLERESECGSENSETKELTTSTQEDEVTSIFDVVAPSAMTPQYPLQDSWVLWYDKITGASRTHSTNYRKCLSQLHTVSYVEDFWRLYNNIQQPSQLDRNANYHFFRENIEPMWEDPANIEGGKWVLTMREDHSILNRAWEELLMAMVGENIECAEGVNGAVMSRRKKGDRIALWTRDKDTQTNLDICADMLRVLAIACERTSEGDIGDFVRQMAEERNGLRMVYMHHTDALVSGHSYKNSCHIHLKDHVEELTAKIQKSL